MSSFRTIAAPLLFALCLAPSIAHAQAADATRVAARTLAFEANAALAKKDYAAAAERFARADALVHAPTLVLGLARANVGLGKLTVAHELYSKIVREGVSPGSPAVFSRAVADAKVELAALELRMPPVTFNEKAGSSPPPVAAGTTVPVPPPSTAPSAAPTTPPSAAPSAPPVIAPLAPTAPQPVSPPSARSMSLERTLGFAAMGVGGAGLVVGVVTGILALDLEGSLAAACPHTRCPPSERSDIDTYSALRIAAGSTLVAGAALAVTGSLLVITMPGPRSRSAFVRPAIGAGSLLLKGTF